MKNEKKVLDVVVNDDVEVKCEETKVAAVTSGGAMNSFTSLMFTSANGVRRCKAVKHETKDLFLFLVF